MGKRRVLILISFLLLSSLCFCGLAFANGNAGEAQPSGGGCYNPSTMSYNSYNDTCYGGVSWRFYTLNGGNYDTFTDSYIISAGNSGSTTIKGCNGTDGYWLLAYERYNTESSYPYVSSYIGSQRGAVQLNMSAHWSSGYARDATLPGSGFPSFPDKVYTSVSDFKANGIKNGSVGSWDMVAGLFAEMPSEYKNGHSWSSDDDLAWFCYDKNSDVSDTNFTNTAVANFTTGDDVVFAGETTGAEISITTTGAKVDNAKYSIVAYTTNSPNKAGSSSYDRDKNADLCKYFTNKTHDNCNVLKSEDNRTLNSGESMSGSTVVKLESYSYRIYDAPAGEYYCIAAAVYPASNNSDSWYISESKCKQIAKKPIFQIWGGGFYSAGNVSTFTTSKGHIVDYHNYSPTGDANALFSSWSELAVVSNGVVSNLASGAATSYTYTNKNAYNYVSNFARDNCQRARLSFANSICSGGTTGSSGIAPDYSIKNTIISRYAAKYISNTVTIAGKTIPQKTVEVTYASGVSITGDILYEDTAYVSASQVPQYIIYSKGDINIACNVNRIDAWLIADGTIYTCSKPDGPSNKETRGLIVDDGAYSHRLTINGVIIADQLNLGRTYGAATGINSGVPAEIINLSGASYIWAENTASDTPKLYTTYLRELAPRY